MTGAKKIAANCSNARASTGPKTARGKARAAGNARRYGLNLSIVSDPVLSEQVEVLARKFVENASMHHGALKLARRVAEHHIDLARIRRTRHDLLVRGISEIDHRENKMFIFNQRLVKKITRLIDPCAPMPPVIGRLFRYLPPPGPKRIAAVVSGLVRELELIDRYERRALSRRKFAIRELDAARKHTAS